MSITVITAIIITLSLVIDVIYRNNYKDLYKGLGYNCKKLMFWQFTMYIVSYVLLFIPSHAFQTAYLLLCLFGLLYQVIHHFIITPMVMKRING